MRTFILAAFLLLLGLKSAAAQELFPLQQVQTTGGGGNSCSSDPLCPAAAANYTLDTNYSDEFNGTSIDTSKWSIGPNGGAATPSCMVYDPSVAYESGGAIHAPITSVGGVFHVAGGVNSVGMFSRQAQYYYPFTDYYSETRMMWSGQPGQMWTGIVQWGLTAPYNGYNLPLVEFDQLEGSSNNWHIWGEGWVNLGGNWVQHVYPGGGPEFGWHVYGKLKQGNTTTFYLDNNVVGVVGPGSVAPLGGDYMPDNVMANAHDTFSASMYSYQGGCPSGPADLQIDYVRVYHGSAPPAVRLGAPIVRATDSGPWLATHRAAAQTP